MPEFWSLCICGNINTDLLKFDIIKEFVDTILDKYTIPYITTRITSQFSALVGHILIHKPSKHIENEIFIGILLFKMRHHPQFAILSGKQVLLKSSPKTSVYSEDNLAKYRYKLSLVKR